jgi:hypothetical protein
VNRHKQLMVMIDTFPMDDVVDQHPCSSKDLQDDGETKSARNLQPAGGQTSGMQAVAIAISLAVDSPVALEASHMERQIQQQSEARTTRRRL